MLKTVINHPVQKQQTGPRCRVWLCDVSGSMYYHIKDLANDLVEQLEHCDPQDVLTVMWFSSQGMRGTIVKGVRVGPDKELIAKAIKAQMYARNLTCFSESLRDTHTIISDLAMYNLPWSLMFYSDGYPVVGDYNKEVVSIMSALRELRPVVSDATMIGYGDYYNRELLLQMSEVIGGVVVHTDALNGFSRATTEHIQSKATPRTKVELNVEEEKNSIHFGISRQTGKVTIFEASNYEVWVGTDYTEIYSVSKTEIHKPHELDNEQIMYALALTYARVGKVDWAVEVLSKLGDVYFVNQLISAFTNAELGVVLGELELAVTDAHMRYRDGQKRNCLPKRDAFCLIEALEILEHDTEARFHPEQGFKYNLTGLPAKVAPGYPEFQRYPDQALPINLTWHESRLNVSLRCEYAGEVVLPDEITNYGYSNPFLAKQFRNYVIIKDGVLNVKVLPVSMSRTTFMAFKGGKLLKQNEEYEAGRVYKLELSRIPIMNRAMADGITAKDTAELALKQLELEVNLKTLKYLRNELDPKKEYIASPFSLELREFLIKHGIDSQGRYSPPTKHDDYTDYYDAKRFEVKVGGAVNLPKVLDVEERVAKGKTLNIAAYYMHEAYTSGTVVAKKQGLAGLDQELAKNKLQLAEIRRQLNRARAAIVLGNRWFPDLGSKENNKLTLGNNTFTFEFSTEKIPY